MLNLCKSSWHCPFIRFTEHYVVSIVLPKAFGYAIATVGKDRFPPSLDIRRFEPVRRPFKDLVWLG